MKKYTTLQQQFKRKQTLKTLRLLRWTRGIYWGIAILNGISNFVLGNIAILLGLYHNICIKLHETTNDNEYLDYAEMVKSQIDNILIMIGEKNE